jgi:hypothetical protein
MSGVIVFEKGGKVRRVKANLKEFWWGNTELY